MSYLDFEDLREQATSFSDLVAYAFTPLAVEHGGLGLVMALASTSVLGSVKLPLPVELSLDLSPDLRLFAFTLGIAFATAVVIGLVPAREALRADLAASLKRHSSLSSIPATFMKCRRRPVFRARLP